MKRSYVAYMLLIATVCVCMSGCGHQTLGSPEHMADIAYVKGAEESAFTVFIQEGNTLVPYLVLTDDYNGNCLLLRKYLLPESRTYNQNGDFAAYYENSLIDQWLNTDFRETLAQPVRDLLINTSIEITSKDSLQGGEERVITIAREIFLLSAREVNESGFRIAAVEGEWLEYFSSIERRTASKDGVNASSWWLRTPDLWDENVVFGVDPRGCVGIGGVGSAGADGEYRNGVRPAFCVSGDTAIYIHEGKYYLVPPEGTGN